MAERTSFLWSPTRTYWCESCRCAGRKVEAFIGESKYESTVKLWQNCSLIVRDGWTGEDNRPKPFKREEAWGVQIPHRSILRLETVRKTICCVPPSLALMQGWGTLNGNGVAQELLKVGHPPTSPSWGGRLEVCGSELWPKFPEATDAASPPKSQECRRKTHPYTRSSRQ